MAENNPGIPPGDPTGCALAYFKYLKSIGIEYLEKVAYHGEPAVASPVGELSPNGDDVETELLDMEEMLKRIKAVKTLAALEKLVKECGECPLHATRTQAVFGSGNPKAGLLFVGEAPGAEEDKQGKPFVGRAGQLLTKMIESIGFSREDVYIANVLKSRPPNNRDPLPNEVAACEPFLIRQIELIKPSLICALGAHAARTLLKTAEPIGRLRGRWHDYHGVPLIPTYHPAFLLRSPQYKKAAWEDLKMLRDEYKKITAT